MLNYTHDICFVGLKCYDLIVGAKTPKFLGGAEKQMVSLARGLADDGMNISFITYDHGQADRVEVGGITVYKCFSSDKGLRGIRFVHPRTTKLWAAMRKANSRIYIQMGAGSETGRVALGCHRFCNERRGFIFCTASDSDCDSLLPRLCQKREKTFYKYGLYNADLIVCQTLRQQHMIRDSFGLASVVISMPCLGLPQDTDKVDREPDPESGRVLWVGRIISVKRLEWLLEIAKMCPRFTFDVIGAPNEESAYAADMRQRAEKIPNVMMHGKVSDSKLESFYRQAAVLCCTSKVEGFPTTFLEAWSYGLPVVTTFDPDSIVSKYGLGFVACSVDEQAGQLKRLIESESIYREISKRVRRYYIDHYSVEAIVPQFIRVFEHMMSRKLNPAQKEVNI